MKKWIVVFATPDNRKNEVFAPQECLFNCRRRQSQTAARPHWQQTGSRRKFIRKQFRTKLTYTRRQATLAPTITFGISMKATFETEVFITLKVITHYGECSPVSQKALPSSACCVATRSKSNSM